MSKHGYNPVENFNPNERVAPCPDDDACVLSRIEVEFGCAVYLTQDQQRRLLDVIEAIVKEPWNEPLHGVHWVGGIGSKPSFSQADQRFLGKPVDPSAPESGEPTFDHSVLHVESVCREFLHDSERERAAARRAKGW